MKKKTTVDIIRQSGKTTLYSISFEMDGTTEFEKFVAEFEMSATFNKDYQQFRLKTAKKYEHDPKLFGYVLDLQRFEKMLNNSINKGYVRIEEKELIGIEDSTFEI